MTVNTRYTRINQNMSVVVYNCDNLKQGTKQILRWSMALNQIGRERRVRGCGERKEGDKEFKNERELDEEKKHEKQTSRGFIE